MNWQNLDRNRCPKCSKQLDFKSDKEMMMCDISCGFMISVKRMQEIVANHQTTNLLKDNQELLNNLDPNVSDDFWEDS